MRAQRRRGEPDAWEHGGEAIQCERCCVCGRERERNGVEESLTHGSENPQRFPHLQEIRGLVIAEGAQMLSIFFEATPEAENGLGRVHRMGVKAVE